MEEKVYNILITASNTLKNQCIAMMLSAILNCNHKLHFYIMQNNWLEDQKEDCREFIGKYPGNAVYFVDVRDDSQFHIFKSYKNVYTIYYKLLAHLYLPNSLERILFIEPDVLIRKDFGDFYNEDFEGNFYIATCNKAEILPQIKNETMLNVKKEDRYKRSSSYSTPGVRLINLKKFRECNIDIDFYKSKIEEFPDDDYWVDSGIANYAFWDKMKLVPSYKFQTMIGYIDTYKMVYSYSREERIKKFNEIYAEDLDTKNELCIIHFVCSKKGAGLKPWNCLYDFAENKIYGPNKTELDVTEKPFFIEWWEMATKLPSKVFGELVYNAYKHYYEVQLCLNKNVLNFYEKVANDYYVGMRRFLQNIIALKGKKIALLKAYDNAGKFIRNCMNKYQIDVVFESHKTFLWQLTDDEFDRCKNADTIIMCSVHGDVPDEKLSIKAIKIWDILRDDSLTADLPEIPDGADNIKIDGSISELHEDILKLSEHINEEFVKLSKTSDEALKDEIKTLHSEKDKLNEEFGRLSSENKSLTERIAQITEEKSTLLENILSVSREKDTLNSELFELNSKLNAEQNAASVAIRKADSLSADISLLKEKIAQLEKEKSFADSELDKTKQELKNEQEASAASAQKAELLNNKILEMQSTRSWRYTRIFRKNKKDEEI